MKLVKDFKDDEYYMVYCQQTKEKASGFIEFFRYNGIDYDPAVDAEIDADTELYLQLTVYGSPSVVYPDPKIGLYRESILNTDKFDFFELTDEEAMSFILVPSL